MKRHRRICQIWKDRDKTSVAKERRRETSLKRYGVDDARRSPEANAQRERTNQERYGAANPFSKEATTFSKVQASLEGKRPVLKGDDNPFAKPGVQRKIRATLQERYGVTNPQQVPEIRAATRATCQERFGGEFLGSPEIRAKAEATNVGRYGVAFPGGTPSVQARVRATNMGRYGVPYTCMDPEVRRKQLETMETNYGCHFFASDEGKEIVRAVLQDRYGVDFPGAIEGHWDKAVAAFRERYGVDHPLQLERFRAKQRATNEKRYGTPFPGLRKRGPNLLEHRVATMDDRLMFTGDGQFWRWLPLLGRHKNPDFIIPGPDPKHPFRGVSKVVEVFGDFWHSRMFTGKAPFEHESELVDAFQNIGIECLVVWEHEVKTDFEGVGGHIHAFLG